MSDKKETEYDPIEEMSKPFYEHMTKEDLHKKWVYFERALNETNKEVNRLRGLLTEAHALVGRTIHKLSHRGDNAPITAYMSGMGAEK